MEEQSENKNYLDNSWKLYECKNNTIEFLSKYIKDYESKILWIIISTLTVIGGLLVYIINYIITNSKILQTINYITSMTISNVITLAIVIVIVLFLCFIGYNVIIIYLMHCRKSMENHINEIDSCVMKAKAEFAGQYLKIRIESMRKTLENIDKSVYNWKRLITIGLIAVFVLAIAIILIQTL